MKRMVFLLLLLPALPGCSGLVPDYSGEDSGYRLILNQQVRVPAERTRVFIQGGRVTGTAFDSYEVSCNLEVRKLADHERRIEPDTFVVTRVQEFFEEVADTGWRPVQLASLELAGAAFDSSPADIFRGWHFWLHSDRQPDVMRLTCRGVFAAPWEARTPDYGEIVATLGEVATLQPLAEAIQPGTW